MNYPLKEFWLKILAKEIITSEDVEHFNKTVKDFIKNNPNWKDTHYE